MNRTTVWMLLLTLALAGTAMAAEEPVKPAQVPEEMTAPAPEADPEVSPDAKALPEQPALSFLYASCSAVCTSFHAASAGDCSDTNCYARGCGAPNYFDSGSCTCYCSYCF